MDLQCQLEQNHGLRRMVSLHRQRCQQLQCIKVPWLRLQDFLVQHFRLIELPLLMQGRSRLQLDAQGLPPSAGRIHGRERRPGLR